MGERRITLRVETRSADSSPSRLQHSVPAPVPGHRGLSSKILQARAGGKDDIVLRWEFWMFGIYHQFFHGLYSNCRYKTLHSRVYTVKAHKPHNNGNELKWILLLGIFHFDSDFIFCCSKYEMFTPTAKEECSRSLARVMEIQRQVTITHNVLCHNLKFDTLGGPRAH